MVNRLLTILITVLVFCSLSPAGDYRILSAGSDGAFLNPVYKVQQSDVNIPTLNRDSFDCVLLFDVSLSKKANEKLCDFLSAGGDLIAIDKGNLKLGDYKIKNNWYLRGKDLSQFGKISPYKSLPVFYKSPLHYYKGATVAGIKNLSGISALGFEYAEQSKYISLLQAVDDYNRPVGFAAGVLVHYDGQFKGGNWFLFGVKQDEFYETDIFKQTLNSAIEKYRNGSFAKQLWQKNKNERKIRLEKTAENLEPLKIDSSGNFIYPDGSRFFMLGVNYLGSFDRKCQQASEQFDITYWDRDFKTAAETGINCFRMWIEGINCRIDRLKSIIALAEKYRIYLILHPTAHPNETDRQTEKMFTCLAKAVKDEPAVLGFDLLNEPMITNVGAMKINGRISPAAATDFYNYYSEGYFNRDWVDKMTKLRSGWPEMGSWVNNKQARNLYTVYDLFKLYCRRFFADADYSTMPSEIWPIPIAEDYQKPFDAINITFANWIRLHRQIIRKYCPDKFITVGYNTALAILKANSQLDFVSHHIYQPPGGFADFQKAVSTFDRLKKLWPDEPITMGEFGYSCGGKMADGNDMDIYTASVAEMLIYMYAFANGFAGGCSWMLSDWPLPVMQLNAPWISEENRKYQAGFGLYYYNGTPSGCAKPIVHAVKALSEYMKNHQTGDGQLELIRQDNQIGCGYVYKNSDALFIGGNQYQSEALSFNSSKAVNLMLWAENNKLNITASGDVEITVRPAEFGIKTQQQTVKLSLLEGKQITVMEQ